MQDVTIVLASARDEVETWRGNLLKYELPVDESHESARNVLDYRESC